MVRSVAGEEGDGGAGYRSAQLEALGLEAWAQQATPSPQLPGGEETAAGAGPGAKAAEAEAAAAEGGAVSVMGAGAAAAAGGVASPPAAGAATKSVSAHVSARPREGEGLRGLFRVRQLSAIFPGAVRLGFNKN